MPWELTILHPHGHRLGSPKEVMTALSRAWPELDWLTLPPLLEQIGDQPDHPLHAQLPTWSPEARRRAALPRTVGVLEDEGFSVEISGLEDDPVEELYADVRGNGDPTPALLRLKKQSGWSLKEMVMDRFLDERQVKERWDNYKRMRDAAVDPAN
ncbi:MAG: hypothetical protein HY293_13570 [Planctomycetes bacterium]|nr:hypothetical protein [Planctomycetota bacterium]